jgi:hypothetical protein
LPEGAATVVIEGRNPTQATYEPFSPSTFYQLAGMELDAPIVQAAGECAGDSESRELGVIV